MLTGRFQASYRAVLCVLTIANALVGFATSANSGDFGRLERSVFELGPLIMPAPGPPLGSFYPLTDDEEELRDRAYLLIKPPEERHVFKALLAKLRSIPVWGLQANEIQEYGIRLISTHHRSEVARYAQLQGDIDGDLLLIGPFVTIACRVADLDHKRERSLRYVSYPTPSERENARGRIRENTMVIVWVKRGLEARISAFRFALERLVIATPSPMAADAEHALARLKEAVAQAQVMLSQCTGGGEITVQQSRRYPAYLPTK